ncbi:MAG: hypothetical protein LIP18_03420 [Planctomycetes bacterium]|nr:hypothetical protein [Planctomycetota bacterium]
MDKEKFSKICDSLRQYRRAELKDFDKGQKSTAIDALYVDPLSSDVVLQQVLAPNTTFLVGKKGTGKSTIFAKAQSEIRKDPRNISIYLDVKAVYELVNANDIVFEKSSSIKEDVLRVHLWRKEFLRTVILEIIKELKETSKKSGIFAKLSCKHARLNKVIADLDSLGKDVRAGKLTSSELPVIQIIEKNARSILGLRSKIRLMDRRVYQLIL